MEGEVHVRGREVERNQTKGSSGGGRKRGNVSNTFRCNSYITIDMFYMQSG